MRKRSLRRFSGLVGPGALLGALDQLVPKGGDLEPLKRRLNCNDRKRVYDSNKSLISSIL
jgi:hypothetical protein